ncbi:hypothetical protein [Nocardiopsis synnemataformans]|uniref:hypothetical protein n=1 Tax=Nocardiopsis synnemataformans TaxID=61305 RepID=UPI003EB896A9
MRAPMIGSRHQRHHINCRCHGGGAHAVASWKKAHRRKGKRAESRRWRREHL